MVGPGNFPFMVTMGLVEHNLVAFFSTTCEEHHPIKGHTLQECGVSLVQQLS